jgi:phosphatidylglycerophosphate synthase
MSWQFPRSPLRRRALAAFAAAVVATLALAWVLSAVARIAPGYVAKAGIVSAAIGVVALGWLEGRHPHRTFGAANWVTTLRAVLVALVAALVGEPRTGGVAAVAVGGAVLASVLDGVDGWAARWSGTASEFGARYDMETDALLILVLSVLAWQHGRAGWWILLAGMMRYGFIAAGFAWRWMNATLPPSTRRKTVCVLQIAGLAVVVSPVFTPAWSAVIAALTLLTLVYSFAVDVRWLREHGA